MSVHLWPQRSHLAVWAALLCALLLVSACVSQQAPGLADQPADTIVIVHGAWGGGWQWHKVEPLLEARGYRVYRPTMTGLGERVHLAGPDVGLDTHIEDIVKVLEFEALSDVILVGHSYGGMVISGVADRAPERIARLVYLDAILPEDGESVDGLFGKGVGQMATRGGGGYESWQLVPRWVEPGTPPPVDVPQPAKSFSDPITLGNHDAAKLRASFILTREPGAEHDDFEGFAERARARGWPVLEMEGDHNPHWFQPEEFVEVLIQAIDSTR